MIKRIVGWVVLVPSCAALVIFALANRHVVPLRFDPISTENPLIASADVPLFVVIYGMLFIGIILGGIAMWFAQGRNRREKRQLKRDSARLTRELDGARQHNNRSSAQNSLYGPDDLLEDD